MTIVVNRLSSFLLLCLFSCGLQQPELTVYVSADEFVARLVFDAFTRESGIQVNWVGDTEATKTTHLVRRILREQEHPVADVFWSSEILGTIQLTKQNVLSACRTEITEKWPNRHRDNQYRWFAFSPRARVIAYDPTRTNPKTMPKYWDSYTQAAIADPRFGTTGTHLVAMWSRFGVLEFDRFIHSMESKPLIGGNAATVQAVIDGRFKYAMTDSDDVFAAKANGASIEMFFPRHHSVRGGGTLMIPNTVAIVQGCRHRTNAEIFIEFMLSDHVAILLAKSPSRNFPTQPHIAELFPELTVQDPLDIDFELIAEHKDQVVQEYMIAIGQHSEQ